MTNSATIIFEVTVNPENAKEARMYWRDWYEHLSNDMVWTKLAYTDTFQFCCSDDSMIQEAEAFAYDFHRMCKDNYLDVDSPEQIELI